MDGPEDRSLESGCLVFNAGPPICPALNMNKKDRNNNYVRFFKIARSVVISTR